MVNLSIFMVVFIYLFSILSYSNFLFFFSLILFIHQLFVFIIFYLYSFLIVLVFLFIELINFNMLPSTVKHFGATPVVFKCATQITCIELDLT